jgi:hypothetical protein
MVSLLQHGGLLVVLFQAHVLKGAYHRDLIKQGTHVLSVTRSQRPTLMMSQVSGVVSDGYTPQPSPVALVPDGEKGNWSTSSVLQVLLAELCEGKVDNPLQCVIHVVTMDWRGPRHPARL